MTECMDEKKGCTVVNHYYGDCGGNGNVNPGAENIYSTEETICGTWTDGTPIYRKVIAGKFAKDSGNGLIFANVSDLKIDLLINLYGNAIVNRNTAQMTMQVSYNTTNGLSAAVNMYYHNETGNICYQFLNNGGDYSGCAANVIIEYTKK